jgi:hypothetical protein
MMFPVPPKHAIGEATEEEATTAVGSGTLMVVDAVQPFPSVIVNVEFPAKTVKLPVPVYGKIPPVPETSTCPLPPLHKIDDAMELEAVKKEGCVKVIESIAVQPFASVTVTVYVPDARFKADAPVAPLFHKYVYGAVPPFGVAVAVPFAFPLQVGLTPANVTLREVGSITIMFDVFEHPFASLTV